jgi:hypothetical protein
MAVVTFSHRHMIILALGAALACRHQAPVAPLPATPAETVEAFLAAVNASNQERMAGLFGDENGPVSSTRRNSDMVRTQQMTIFQRLLHGEAHEITATDLTTRDKPKLSVMITQGTRRFTVPFTLIRARQGGWLVWQIDLTPAMPTAGTQPR